MGKLIDVEIIDLPTTESQEFIEILWTALNPDGVNGRNKDILNDPIIRPYYEDWGHIDDIGYAALIDKNMIGAIWSRIKGCVAKKYSDYPELVIGVLPEYQNIGIGSLLMKSLINTCSKKYPGLRLGVNEKAIRVISFYTKFGFIEYDKYNGAPQLKLIFKS